MLRFSMRISQPVENLGKVLYCIYLFILNWRIIALRIALVSAKHQHESALGLPMSPPICIYNRVLSQIMSSYSYLVFSLFVYNVDVCAINKCFVNQQFLLFLFCNYFWLEDRLCCSLSLYVIFIINYLNHIVYKVNMFIITNSDNTNVYSGKWRFHSFLSHSLEVNMYPFCFLCLCNIYVNYTCNWIYIHIYIPLSVFWFKKDLTVYF